MKYNIGDKIRITKPKHTELEPGWIGIMDVMDGKVVILKKHESQWWIIDGHFYNERWFNSVKKETKTFKGYEAFDHAMDVLK